MYIRTYTLGLFVLNLYYNHAFCTGIAFVTGMLSVSTFGNKQFQDGISALERELELKRAIVDATKRLVDETHNKKLKRDRKKELKEQIEKVRA